MSIESPISSNEKPKQIIALHGLCGAPEDWSIVASLLPPGFKLIAADSFSSDWIKILTATPDSKIILAHSWAAYLFLQKAFHLERYIEKVILVNPLLQVENKLPAFAGVLLSLPIFNDLILKKSHQEAQSHFVKKMLYPSRPKDIPYTAEIQKRLNSRKPWKQAAQAKWKHQKNPLTNQHASRFKGIALFGEKDQTINPEHQKDILKLFPNISTHVVKGQGHGLLWTRPEEIITAITGIPKIGYHPGEESRNNVTWYLQEHLKNFPQRAALQWISPENLKNWDGNHQSSLPHESISFQDFATRIDSLAQGLLEAGIEKGDRVIVFLPMTVDMYTSLFAVQKIGAIAVFLDSWARSHHLGASAECVNPKAMISFEQAFQLIQPIPEFQSMEIRILYGPSKTSQPQALNITHTFDSLFKAPLKSITPVSSESTALITFTTGSTGKPKGANRTHRFLSAQHHSLKHVIPYGETDLDMPAFPIFSLNNLASGVTTILPAINLAAPSSHDSALLVAQIIHQKINCTTLSPSMLVGVSKYCKAHHLILSSLKRVVTGGAPISKDDVRAFYEIAPQSQLWILYGSTEAEPMAHIEGREMLEEALDGSTVEEGVNVGPITEDIDYKFIKIHKGPIDLQQTSWAELEVPPHQVGEFICTGDHVCRDYYNNPEAFAATKILDEQNRVWHRTGDLAYLDPQKNLWIVGRVNNAIIREGKHFFPVRAEVLLKRLDFTHRCAFLGLADEQLGQKTVAAIELSAPWKLAHFDFKEGDEQVKTLFKTNDIPVDEVVFVEKIPMDPRHHSKVEYAELAKLLETPLAIKTEVTHG